MGQSSKTFIMHKGSDEEKIGVYEEDVEKAVDEFREFADMVDTVNVTQRTLYLATPASLVHKVERLRDRMSREENYDNAYTQNLFYPFGEPEEFNEVVWKMNKDVGKFNSLGDYLDDNNQWGWLDEQCFNLSGGLSSLRVFGEYKEEH